jgi:hypothetical protein
MALAISLLLAAAGAILIWGIDAEAAGVDLDVIGVIGLIVGVVAAVLVLVTYLRDRGPADPVRRTDSTVDR